MELFKYLCINTNLLEKQVVVPVIIFYWGSRLNLLYGFKEVVYSVGVSTFLYHNETDSVLSDIKRFPHSLSLQEENCGLMSVSS